MRAATIFSSFNVQMQRLAPQELVKYELKQRGNTYSLQKISWFQRWIYRFSSDEKAHIRNIAKVLDCVADELAKLNIDRKALEQFSQGTDLLLKKVIIRKKSMAGEEVYQKTRNTLTLFQPVLEIAPLIHKGIQEVRDGTSLQQIFEKTLSPLASIFREMDARAADALRQHRTIIKLRDTFFKGVQDTFDHTENIPVEVACNTLREKIVDWRAECHKELERVERGLGKLSPSLQKAFQNIRVWIGGLQDLKAIVSTLNRLDLHEVRINGNPLNKSLLRTYRGHLRELKKFGEAEVQSSKIVPTLLRISFLAERLKKSLPGDEQERNLATGDLITACAIEHNPRKLFYDINAAFRFLFSDEEANKKIPHVTYEPQSSYNFIVRKHDQATDIELRLKNVINKYVPEYAKAEHPNVSEEHPNVSEKITVTSTLTRRLEGNSFHGTLALKRKK